MRRSVSRASQEREGSGRIVWVLKAELRRGQIGRTILVRRLSDVMVCLPNLWP
jgi:hypothetical protein